ncbi:MAG: iron-containing alcohol dehydrogenase [Betaproteobacteria bacterium]|nr:iron-containing alcohol dehydrogenase [Betaproteobacteria bacterium]
MVAMAGVVGTVVRSVGLSTAMRAAGVVTGMLPIPQPVLLVGPGSSARLGQAIAGFGHRNVLIVTDRGVAGLGLPGALVKALSAGGVRHVVFDDVSPDAPIPQIERGIAFYRERRCDAVVAFGGGSPMDAGKAIAHAVGNGKHPRKLVGYFRGLRPPEPLYAVPTTAGTGSEVTVAAVISDPDAERKLVIADTRLVPAMAALDAALMTGLPKHVTAATGMDALTHAIEAFLGQWATPQSDRMALACVGLVFAHLRRAVRNGRSLEAREQMALAAAYGGLAFTRANVGYVHAIAHQLGAKYHVPHGLANAIVLPHVLRFLAPAVTSRLAALALRAGVGSERERPAALAKKFIASIDVLNRDIGIPSCVEPLRAEDIPALAGAACWEADTSYPVPRYMSAATCEQMLRGLLPPGGRVSRRRLAPR